MFVRTKTFKNKDGSIREYLFICETRREGNKVRQITLANLGRAICRLGKAIWPCFGI